MIAASAPPPSPKTAATANWAAPANAIAEKTIGARIPTLKSVQAHQRRWRARTWRERMEPTLELQQGRSRGELLLLSS